MASFSAGKCSLSVEDDAAVSLTKGDREREDPSCTRSLRSAINIADRELYHRAWQLNTSVAEYALMATKITPEY